jgi:hypothetical protein
MAQEATTKIELAKELVKAARYKKQVEGRCLNAFGLAGEQLISDADMFSLAHNIVSSVDAFVIAGEKFEHALCEG